MTGSLPSHHDPASAPSDWIVRWAAQLRPGASVLDVACGSGRHVRWLAARGLAVTALDRDGEALAPLRGLPGVVDAIVADLERDRWPLPQRRFDALVVTNYLWRPLWPSLLGSLAAGGLLLYETFSVEQATVGRPSNPAFLLEHGELLDRCAGLRVLAYEDGWLDDPRRAVQRIAAFDLSAAPPRLAL